MWLAVGLGMLNLGIPTILLSIFGSCVPTIVVIAVLGVTRDSAGRREVFGRFLRWRVGFRWYLVAISPVAVSLVAAGLYFLFGGEATPADPEAPAFSVPSLLVMLLMGLLMGPLSEEAGWRGFALPRLQSRYNALVSSLILGLIWAVWHLPLWFVDTPQASMSFWLFSTYLVFSTVVMTWAYNNSEGSLVLAVLFHLFANFGNEVATSFLRVPLQVYLPIVAGLYVAYAVIVAVAAGPAHLSRTRERSMVQFRAEPAP